MGTLADDDLVRLLGAAAESWPLPDDGAGLALAPVDDAVVVPLVRRRRVQAAAAAAVVVGLTLGVAVFGGDEVDRVGQLAGVGAGTRGDGRATEQRVPGAAAAPAPVRDDLGQNLDTATAGGAAGGSTTASGGSDTGGSTAGARAGAPASAQVPSVTDGARVVKRGAVALVVDDGQVTSTLTRVSGFAADAGGLVAGTRTEESGRTPSGVVTLRVPVERFELVVTQVRGLPGEVRSATTSAQDVTGQYADLEAQLRTLKAARERFLAILARADSIGDVLSVQQRVDDVTGRIDRLEGQRRVLEAQSESATLEVTVTEQDDPVVVAGREPDDGLPRAFDDAVTGFTTGIEALVRLSGRGLLLVLLGGTSWLVLRLGWRAARRRAL